jgi:hypothetical protein
LLRITANQPFGEWGRIFPDRAMTLAAIDRLVRHATILEMNVESYCRKAALYRERGRGRPPAHARPRRTPRRLKVARAGIARTYQTTQLFGSLGVVEIAQFLPMLVGEDCWCGLHVVAESRQHETVDCVRLGELAGSLGELAHTGRIDDGRRHALGSEGFQD